MRFSIFLAVPFAAMALGQVVRLPLSILSPLSSAPMSILQSQNSDVSYPPWRKLDFVDWSNPPFVLFPQTNSAGVVTSQPSPSTAQPTQPSPVTSQPPIASNPPPPPSSVLVAANTTSITVSTQQTTIATAASGNQTGTTTVSTGSTHSGTSPSTGAPTTTPTSAAAGMMQPFFGLGLVGVIVAALF